MPHFNAKNSPTAWFAVLERARLTGDKALESRAMERLADLGVVVRFCEGRETLAGHSKREGVSRAD